MCLSFILSVGDITAGKPKTIVTTLFEQFWSVGVILLPILARLFKSWSHLYMAISWPTVILIILWRYVCDSQAHNIPHILWLKYKQMFIVVALKQKEYLSI